MKNVGKIFEDQFKKSIPDYCHLTRLNDPPQSYVQSHKTSFSNTNPYDFEMFDTQNRLLYCFELKSTKKNYVSFEDITLDEQPQRLIKKHQILGLLKSSKYNYTYAGFLMNFRDEKNQMERTYFLNIKDFMRFYNITTKHSINELDVLCFGGIKIDGEKQRKYYLWDVDGLINKLKY